MGGARAVRISQRVQKLKEARKVWEDNIVGQREFINTVWPYVERVAVNMVPENKPAGTFILAGPPGTGKSFSVAVLKEALGKQCYLFRIDCTEYQDSHEVSKIYGPPPGFIGYDRYVSVIENLCDINKKLKRWNDNQGEKEDDIRYPGILLLDEFEKADVSMQRLLVGALEEGVMMDSKGNTWVMGGWLIFMTTNIGSSEILESVYGADDRPGFVNHAINPEKTREIINRHLKRVLLPELRSRIDELIVFTPLTTREVKKVVELEIIRALQLAERNKKVEVKVSKAKRKALAEKLSQDPRIQTEGMRFIRREVRKELLGKVARKLLENPEIEYGGTLRI